MTHPDAQCNGCGVKRSETMLYGSLSQKDLCGKCMEKLHELKGKEQGLVAMLREVQRAKDKGNERLLEFHNKQQDKYHEELIKCRYEIQKLAGRLQAYDEDFCNNCCENEATGYYTTECGTQFLLCDNCNDAFGLGQANPDAEFKRTSKRHTSHID